MELWWVGDNGAVQDANWYEGGKGNRFDLAPGGGAAGGRGLVATTRIPDSMEVWWIGANGAVQDANWYPDPQPVNSVHIHDNITFSSGVALGGWFDLALTRQGDISFSGHFHDSGADSYDTTLVVVLMTPEGLAYSVTHQGRTHGTFESGSRDDDWAVNEHSDMVAKNWDAQFAQARWRWSAHAGSLIGGGLGDFIKGLVKELADEAGKAGVAAAIALI